MTDLYSAEDVAREIGIPEPSTVRKIAKRDGIGQQVAGRWVFVRADIARIEAGYQGCPGSLSAYTPEERAAAVADAERDGFDAVAERMGLARITLYRWRENLRKN